MAAARNITEACLEASPASVGSFPILLWENNRRATSRFHLIEIMVAPNSRARPGARCSYDRGSLRCNPVQGLTYYLAIPYWTER